MGNDLEGNRRMSGYDFASWMKLTRRGAAALMKAWRKWNVCRSEPRGHTWYKVSQKVGWNERFESGAAIKEAVRKENRSLFITEIISRMQLDYGCELIKIRPVFNVSHIIPTTRSDPQQRAPEPPRLRLTENWVRGGTNSWFKYIKESFST